MKSILNDKLKQKIEEAGLSVHALEKKAGLKRSAVQNILHGRSKKPSAEILYAISKVFGCSIRELLDKDSPPISYPIHPNPSQTTAQTPFNIQLYGKAVEIAHNILKKHAGSYNESQALNYIQELYQYSINSTHKNIDAYFAEWLFKKLFHGENA